MISLHLEFVPSKLTFEPDEAKTQFQYAKPLIFGRLGKSPDMVNPPLILPGVYSFHERLREGRILLNEYCGIISS